MAEGVLFDLAGKVLELLGSLTLQEIKLACGVKAELENLKSKVCTIQAVLLDAEKQASHSVADLAVKDWLERLKDLFLDADDLLDDFSTEAMQREMMTGNKMTKEVRIFFSSSNQLAYSIKMGHRIKAIRERLNVIENDMTLFDFIESLSEPQVKISDRETYSFVLEEDVVGREDDKKAIIERLFDDIENISIIPIVGIGGIGKTTLAQLIYNDENVKKEFELKLWICISDNFDVKKIVKQILESLKVEAHEENLENLQNRLREKLNGKKYFIVFDDVWNEDEGKWHSLKNLLMGGAKGSRIIVTTRSDIVAKIIGTTSAHALKGLPEEKVWSLFVKTAFKGGEEPNNQALLAIGKQIVRKCNGVPLAIRIIGRLLFGKTSEIEWQSFLDSELSKIAQQGNNILSTLKLSYDNLPSHLKQCFAYCRLFPKDHRIHVNTLISLWAAQGFIVLVDPRRRFEDIGKEYFMELLWRSFFQDVENDGLGNIESCKMHDLIHDLATHVGGKESTMLNLSGDNIGEKVRHVSFDLVDSSSQFQIPMLKGKKIRTILFFKGSLGSLTCDALVSNLNYLRTLDLSNLKLRVVPHSIGELKHLRYLDLSSNYIKILPNSITKLLNLQTLKLSWCTLLKELPRGIKKLVNLRHLDISGCDELTHMPLGLRHLTSLEILSEFVVSEEGFNAARSSCGWCKTKKATSSGGLSELKELSNLGGSLWIHNLGHGKDDMVECKATNMKEKQHLQQLALTWDYKWDEETECYDEESLEGLQPHPNLKALELWYYMGVRIPNWVSSLTNLVSLEFCYNERLQHLPPLNKLRFLKSLRISSMFALEYISEEEEDSVSNVFGGSSSSSSKTIEFFPSLSDLLIWGCPNLKGWWRKDYDNEPDHLLLPSFPCLSKLQIEFCPNLTSMPLFPHLKEDLHLWKTSSKVLQQTMKMGTRQRASTATTSTSTSTSSSSCFPLSQLQSLKLWDVTELEFLPEEWLGNLTSLQHLQIRDLPNLTSLPPINKLPFLKSLIMDRLEALEYISEEEEDSVSNVFGGSSSSSSKTIEFFPSLSSLYIGECPNLKGWWRKDYDNEPDHLLLPSFPCLSQLSIYDCPELTSMPPFPYLKENLELRGVSSKVLQQTMKMGTRQRASTATTSTSTSSSSCFPLSQLQSLELEDVKDLESLPEEWLRNLTSLQRLKIRNFPNLTSLPPLNKLPFLKSLTLYGLDALEYISEEEEDSVSNVFGGSSSSSSKTIEFFTSLTSLWIQRCPNLKGWWRKDYDNEPDHLLLPSFPCLSKLWIINCPKLTSMPPFPYLKELLQLNETSSKVLQQTMKMGTRQRASTATTSTSTSSSSCFPLSQLQSLHLSRVTDLESLPEEWLGNLTSLQRLAIGNCPNLTSLPQGIRDLKSLQDLSIRGCPILGQRCQRQTGEDWPNIAHVPVVEVD